MSNLILILLTFDPNEFIGQFKCRARTHALSDFLAVAPIYKVAGLRVAAFIIVIYKA